MYPEESLRTSISQNIHGDGELSPVVYLFALSRPLSRASIGDELLLATSLPSSDDYNHTVELQWFVVCDKHLNRDDC